MKRRQEAFLCGGEKENPAQLVVPRRHVLAHSKEEGGDLESSRD